MISPSTYSQYRQIFSDWPARAPGADLVSIDESKTAAAPNVPAGGAKPRDAEVERLRRHLVQLFLGVDSMLTEDRVHLDQIRDEELARRKVAIERTSHSVAVGP